MDMSRQEFKNHLQKVWKRAVRKGLMDTSVQPKKGAGLTQQPSNGAVSQMTLKPAGMEQLQDIALTCRINSVEMTLPLPCRSRTLTRDLDLRIRLPSVLDTANRKSVSSGKKKEAALMGTIVTLIILIRLKMVRMSSLDLNIRVVSSRQDVAKREETVLSAMKERKNRSQRIPQLVLLTRFKN